MTTEISTTPRKSVVLDMASRYGMEPSAFEATLRATVMPADKEVTREQFAAFFNFIAIFVFHLSVAATAS